MSPGRLPKRTGIDQLSRATEAFSWFTTPRFAGVLGLLLAVTFWQVLAGRMTFFYRDYSSFTYPVAWHLRECFWRRESPLWNPWNDTGLPFLAQWNTAALYPLSLFYLLFPMPWSLGVFQVLHLFFGGMGMYFLARCWTGNDLAAAMAALGFAFCGLSWHLMMWVSNLAALAWMPWVVLAAERVWMSSSSRSLAAAAITGALQMLTGAPELILQTWCFLGLLGLVYAVRVKCKSATAGRLLLLVLLVAGLSAAQLAPFLDLVVHSHRHAEFSASEIEWAMPSYGLANFLVPLFHCCASAHRVFVQVRQGWATSYYSGIGLVMLGVVSVWRVRTSNVLLLAGGLALSVWLAVGSEGGLLSLANRVVPQLGYMRYPIKFISFAAFALPLLAAYAIAWSLENGNVAAARRSITTSSLIVAGMVGLILLWAWNHPFVAGFMRENVAVTLRNGVTRLLLLALMAGVLLFILKKGNNLRVQVITALALLFLQWLDVRTHMPVLQPLVEAAVYQPGLIRKAMKLPLAGAPGEPRLGLTDAVSQKVKYIGIQDPLDDCLLARSTFYDDCNLLDHIIKPDGFFSIYLRDTKRVLDVLAVSQVGHTALEAMLDFLGLRYLGVAISLPSGYVEWTERLTWMPLVTAGQTPTFLTAKDFPSVIFLRKDLDLRREVFLPPEASASISATNLVKASVKPGRYTAQELDFEVEASNRALVVVAQAFYHPWHAYVDGRRVKVWEANGGFQALEVPAGKHQVKVVYEDWMFYGGAAISFVSMLVAAALWFRAPAAKG